MTSVPNKPKGLHFSESLALKLVSLLLSLILWVTILGFKKEELEKQVPIEFLLPPGVVITNKIPHTILFRLSGPRIALKNVEKHILPIRPDLRHTTENTIAFTVSEELLGELGGKVKVLSFAPSHILIRLEEIVQRQIPVKPVFKGAMTPPFEVKGWKIHPPSLMISGPKSVLEILENVWTEPIDLATLDPKSETQVTVGIDRLQGMELPHEQAVRVRINFKQRKE